MTDSTVTSLHTVFVIIYLQEFAWIFTPLLISGNVFLHAYLRKVPQNWLIFSGGIFCFFLISGIALTISLYVAHTRALCQKRPKHFLPYIIIKIIRIVVLSAVSLVILLTPQLITVYFYASVYGLFECAAGAIALEVTFRSWRALSKLSSNYGRRRQSASDAPTALGHSKQTLVASCAE